MPAGRNAIDSQPALTMRRRTQCWDKTGLGPPSEWPASLIFALALIDRATQPMLVTWGEDRLIFYNDAYAPILDGKPGSEGRPIAQVFEESWDVVGDILAKAESGESAYIEDLRVPITRAGVTEDSWWTLSYSKLPTLGDEGPGVLCVVHETTRLHMAENALHKAENELRRITDLVPSLLWKADGFGRTVWQNGRLADLAASHGADAANVWRKLMHPADIEILLQELARAKAERRPFSQAVRLCMADKSYRWHQVRSEPTLDSERNLVGWYGVATDIQDVRDAITSLEEGSAIFAQFASNAAAMLWVADVESGEVRRLTPNFAEVWEGLTPSQAWTIEEFIASVVEKDRPAIRAGFQRAAAGDVMNGRFSVVGASGPRLLQGTTFPILSPNGQVLRLGGILTDITRDQRFKVVLIDSDAGSQNRLAHQLRRAGLDVVTFDTVEQFAAVAPGLSPGPVLVRYGFEWEALERLAGVVRTLPIPRPWIVVRQQGGTTREAVEIMRLGAADVVDDNPSGEDLATALRLIASAAARLRTAPTEEPVYRLTAKELEIARAIAAGGTNKTVGLSLGLSPRTVETHRGRVMERLGVTTLAELVVRVTSPAFKVELKP